MTKNNAITKLQALIERLEGLPRYETNGNNTDFKKWYRDTEIAIENIFGSNTRHSKDFTDVSFSVWVVHPDMPDYEFLEAHMNGRATAKSVLLSLIDEIREYWPDDPSTDSLPLNTDFKSSLLNLLNNFHKIAKQLLIRHDERATLEINDEYDVQDLVHALLKLHTDDIRPEEYTPSHGGGSGRIDFLLMDQKIAIEIKKTRENLKDKKLGEELMIDIMRYKSHPKVRTLICFVYDPHQLIRNPYALEKDLSTKGEDLETIVLISPKP